MHYFLLGLLAVRMTDTERQKLHVFSHKQNRNLKKIIRHEPNKTLFR